MATKPSLHSDGQAFHSMTFLMNVLRRFHVLTGLLFGSCLTFWDEEGYLRLFDEYFPLHVSHCVFSYQPFLLGKENNRSLKTAE